MASHKDDDAPGGGRTTGVLYLRVPHEVVDRAEINARRLGLSVSEYVSILIRGREPVGRPAANMQDVALAGNRIVRAIAELQKPEPEIGATVRLLRDAQRSIADELQKAHPAYVEAVAAADTADNWSNSRSSPGSRPSSPS